MRGVVTCVGGLRTRVLVLGEGSGQTSGKSSCLDMISIKDFPEQEMQRRFETFKVGNVVQGYSRARSLSHTRISTCTQHNRISF